MYNLVARNCETLLMNKVRIRIIETLIWTLIVSIGLYFSISVISHKAENRQHYQVRFKDVDGLIVGSPVRLMGIQIGYVSKIEPIFDIVYLTFVINKPDAVLPKHAVIDVQFTGMAGSKSLEIVQAQPDGKSRFEIEEPLRVDHVIHIQDAIADALLAGSRTCLGLIGDKSSEETQHRIVKLKTITNNDKGLVSQLNQTLTSIQNKVLDFTGHTKSSVSKVNNSLNITEIEKDNIIKALKLVSDISSSVEHLSSKKSFNLYTKKLLQLDMQIEKISKKIPDTVAIKSSLDCFSDQVNGLSKIDFSKQKFDEIKQTVHEIKETSEDIQKLLK